MSNTDRYCKIKHKSMLRDDSCSGLYNIHGGAKMPDWFGADRFERAFRAAVRHYDITVEDKINDNRFLLSRDGVSIEADTSALRKKYARTRSQGDADEFAEELDYRLLLEGRLNSLNNAQSVLRLIMLNETEAEEDTVSAPFAGTLTKNVCYVGDRNDIHMLNKKYLKKWGVPKEVLFSLADRNMGQLLPKLNISLTRIVEGVNAVEIRAEGNALAVSCMMCGDFREFIAERLGDSFLVAVPSRETLLAVHDIPKDIFDSLAEAVRKDYQWADSPLTTDIFYFTHGDIKVIRNI